MPEDVIQQLENQLEHLVTDGVASPEVAFLEEHYSLPFNPFAPNGIADASGDNPPLRSDDYRAVLDFIIKGYKTKQRQMMVLKGDYGTGKTHILRYVEQMVNQRMSWGGHAARAVYVERPRIEAHELNRNILRSLGYDTVKKYIWFVIRHALIRDMEEGAEVFTKIRNSLLAVTASKGKVSGTRSLWDENDPSLSSLFGNLFEPDTLRDHRTFFDSLRAKGFRREDLRPYFVDLLLNATGYNDDFDLGQIFVALLLASDEAKFTSWEALTNFTGVKAASVPTPAMFLQFLLQVMALNGIVYVYLLLDEFEEVPQGQLLTARQRQDYLYTVREVLNKIPSGLSIIIGISPAGWDALARLATPLADASDNVIELKPVSVGDAITLARFYFRRVRHGTEFEPIVDTLPLSQDVIAHIHAHFPKSAQPTTRNWIQFYHLVLDRVVEREMTTVTLQDVDSLLAEFGALKAGSATKTGGSR